MADDRIGRCELALYAIAWIAAFAIGAVHPATQVAVAAASLALFAAVGIGPIRARGYRLNPIVWVMIAALGWTVLQLVPLPIFALRALSPRAAALRAELGLAWAPITLDVPATILEAVKQVGYLAVFLVGAELLRSREATRRAAGMLGVLGVAIAAAIVIHRATGAQTLFGVYEPREHPGSGYFAPFVNGNHAASVLALCSLASLGLAAGSERGRRFLWIALGTVSAVAVLTTMSRGGAVAFALGGFVLGSLLATARFGPWRGLALSTVVLVFVGGGALVLSDGLRTRFVHHAQGESNWSNQKTRGWVVAAELAARYPIAGVGRGAFEAPAAELRPEAEGVRLVYAEDVVLQIGAEWGIVAGATLLVAALIVFGGSLRRLPVEPETAGLAAGVTAVAVHGLLDCGFEIPGVLTAWTVALAALVARSEANRRTRRHARPRATQGAFVVGAAVATAVILLGIGAVPTRLDVETHALREALRSGSLPPRDVVDGIVARHPASGELETIAGEIAIRRRDPLALHHLSRAMRLQPSLARPHQLAALELLQLRRVAQAALEYRLAIERGAYVPEADRVRYLGRYAVDSAPQTPVALCEMGRALAVAKRWDDAEVAFQRAGEEAGGASARAAQLDAFAQAPPDRRAAAADRLVAQATGSDELASALKAYSEMRRFDQAEAVFEHGTEKFPPSALLVAEAARSRAARGDLDGARKLVAKTGRFDALGRLRLGELAIDLAQRAGDVEGASAAKARLRLLRAKADLEQPAGDAR